ncbi:hypothetical protein ACHAXT_008900 [Thalassiosira profunda]
MSSPAEVFVKKWKELLDSSSSKYVCYLPLGELLELTKNCTADAVREGLTTNPELLHGMLVLFEEEDPQEMIEIVRLLLDICPEAAGIPEPSHDTGTLVYPLHETCRNSTTPSEVIELLLEKSTAGLNHMIVSLDGIVEWCGTTKVAGTPLHYYLYWGKGDIAIVKRLVEACPDTLMMKDTSTDGLTPLHTVLRAPSKPDLEVVKFLVGYNPSLLRESDAFGQNSLHLALQNEYITLEVVELLFESAPIDAWEMSNHEGFLPVQTFLRFGAEMNRDIEALTIGILKLFVRMYRNGSFFREADGLGKMPIHHAASAGHGAEFCKLLVELAPGCERVPDSHGQVPLYGACHIDTVKYLVGLYPDSIYLQNLGSTPFYDALHSVNGRYRDEIMQYFLELDPSFASSAAMKYVRGLGSRSLLPLHAACINWGYYGCEWRRLEVVKILFDCHPSAILVTDTDGKLPVDLAKWAMAKEKEESPSSYHHDKHKKSISFLETQYPFVADASNSNALNTPDKNGMLLLHRALLKKDISLGTVKIIVEGTNHHNAAMRGPNPLHLACANCAPDVIQYLSGVYEGLVNSVDDEGCNLLHLACKAGNLKAVKYLLEQHAPMVSETNNMNLLPIHLLCDKSGKEEICRDWFTHWEYVGLIWQFLLAHPAAVSSAIDRNHRDTVC